MASSNTSWMPAHGRHRVEIGSSLARSLKSRKLNGEAPPPSNKRSHLPDKDFYSFRYNHKPPSVDLKKPGMIEFKKKDAASKTNVILEQPSVQAGESAMFRGQETPLNKNDCVLIYDEDTGTFTLEKLDACIQLTSDRSLPSIITQSSSPTPSTSTPRGGNNTTAVHDATIDQDILDLVDDDIAARPKQKKNAPPPKQEEEEESEDEDDFPIPNRARSSPKPPIQKPPASRPVKAMPKARPKAMPTAPAPAPSTSTTIKPLAAAPPAEPPTRPRAIISSGKGKNQQQRTLNAPPPPVPPAADAEDIPLSKSAAARPARPAARPKPTPALPPPPPPPAALALPGSFSAQTTLPSSLHSSRASNTNGKVKITVEATPAAVPVPDVLSDSDEDDWDEVATSNAAAGNAAAAAAAAEAELSMLEEDIFGGDDGIDGGGDDGGEDDDFQRQLEMEMANMLEVDEEEEDDDDMEPAEIPEVDGPISLNALAGGGGMNVLSDDEFSSSDSESDDD